MPARLRRFRPSDLAEVLRIESASFADDAYPEWIFRRWHTLAPNLFLVATLGGDERRAGTVVGYVIGGLQRNVGRIVSIAVDPPQRRKGLARSLSMEILRRLEGAGVGSIQLETRVDNRVAIHLWEELGFRRIGVLPAYYGGGIDALVMSRPVAG